MKKTIDKKGMVIIAIVAIAGILGAAHYLGYIEIPGIDNIFGGGNTVPSGATKIQASDADIFSALNTITPNNLTFVNIQPYFSTLNIELFCSPMSAYPLIEWYDSTLANDGWSPATDISMRTGANWVSYDKVWTKADQSIGIIVGEGAAVSTVYSCNTVFIIGNGPITTLEQFLLNM